MNPTIASLKPRRKPVSAGKQHTSLRWLSTAVLVLLVKFGALAQDVIIKNDKSEIKAKVLEIGETNVKYKKFEFQDGPTYNLNKAEIFIIIYRNGMRETFDTPAPVAASKAQTPAPVAGVARPQAAPKPATKAQPAATQPSASQATAQPATAPVQTATAQPATAPVPAATPPATADAQAKADMTMLQGTWITPDRGEINVQLMNGGLKVYYPIAAGAYMFYQEKANSVYECTEVKKTLMAKYFPPEFIGSTLTVGSWNHIQFFNKMDGKTTNWKKKAGMTLADNGDIIIEGKKLGKIVKTANGNFLTEAQANFTVYDANDVARFLVDGTMGHIKLLDDNKSTIPNKIGYTAKALAAMFAYDSILTHSGYNEAYRAKFISKNGGYDASNKSERDRTAALSYSGSNILQGGLVIGYLSSFRENTTEKTVIRNLERKPIAVIVVEPTQYSMQKMTILDPNGKQITAFTEVLKDLSQHEDGIRWLVKNRLL